MGRIKMLWEKSVATIRNDGVRAFFLKAIHYIKKNRNKEDNSNAPEKMLMDVLLVNGCYLPHPSRYRVAHQREQLFANGVNSNEVFYEKLSLDLVKRYRVFIFFRCPYTDMVGEFIKLAKAMNKRVLFDIDDLVIDRKYTDQIKYVQSMKAEDKAGYDSGVERMQRTLRLCDGAITTTEQLAEELRKYVPEVYINRNVASDRMVELSKWAVYDRDKLPYLELEQAGSLTDRKRIIEARKAAEKKKASGVVRIGYFSGSITHNDDIQMILPALTQIMKKYPHVELHFIGELDIPKEFDSVRDRIIARPFVPWEELPKLIASVDINIVPLVDTIFNAAKSENKWTEAALVKVPTVASAVGALKQMITDQQTGILCHKLKDWEKALSNLIEDGEKRRRLGEAAYQYVAKHCVTIYSSYPFSQFIRRQMTPNIAFVLPSTQTSGGVLVTLKHASVLRAAGYDVLILNEGFSEKDIEYLDETLPVVSTQMSQIHGSFNQAVATLWSTTNFIRTYPAISQKSYLVQNFETDFYEPGHIFKFSANQTYALDDMRYLTISRWCEKWLRDTYSRQPSYVPNGIELARFSTRKRTFDKKRVRILIEGNSDDYYKNVDEAFKIAEELDKEKYEIWFMSYQGKPKDWYRVDKFLHRVPYGDVPDVYLVCDILLKTSILESFSYPPLEMMATGGYVVAAPNDGNVEYLRHGENCLFYEQGDIAAAAEAIERICIDEQLRRTLYDNGLRTAKDRDWTNIQKDILALYALDQLPAGRDGGHQKRPVPEGMLKDFSLPEKHCC